MTAPGGVLDLRLLRQEAIGRRASIWAGMALLVVIETTVIVSLITSYYYIRVMADAGWPPPGVEPPKIWRPMLSLLVLVATLAPLLWARRAHRRDERVRFVAGVVAGCAMLAGYLAAALQEMLTLPYLWSEHTYGSLVWTLSGYQLFHGLALLGLGVSVLALGSRLQSRARGRTWESRLELPREAAVAVLVLYWVFVVVASVPTYFTLYLSVHLS